MSEPTEPYDDAGPELAQLPAEPWAKIFRQMTIKEWGRAAGTAKALWAATPYPHGTCLISVASKRAPSPEGAALQ